MASTQTETGYHVLAAVGKESHVQPLLAVGCALAAARGGRVTILSVTASGRRPTWLPPEPQVAAAPTLLEGLSIPDACRNVPASVVVRAGRAPGAEILAAAGRDPPDLLLLGWRGQRGGGRYLLGRTLDPVVRYAPCDVAVVRAMDGERALDGTMETMERVLVPVGGGPNAALAIELALDLSPRIQVTALNVAREVHGQVAMSLSHQRLEEYLEPWAGEPRVQGKVVQASSPIKGILTEAAKDYDLVMVGAATRATLTGCCSAISPRRWRPAARHTLSWSSAAYTEGAWAPGCAALGGGCSASCPA